MQLTTAYLNGRYVPIRADAETEHSINPATGGPTTIGPDPKCAASDSSQPMLAC